MYDWNRIMKLARAIIAFYIVKHLSIDERLTRNSHGLVELIKSLYERTDTKSLFYHFYIIKLSLTTK